MESYEKNVSDVVPEATAPAFLHDMKEKDIFAAKTFTYILPLEGNQ
ncbi:MAG: hypothetical protein H7A37_05325 [Chlamydiales bacterium]|nr:hypothetical protein [Chlamydiia bacterium]MCP5507700.1 hypothetical protein [Chlamydiales bacterium]